MPPQAATQRRTIVWNDMDLSYLVKGEGRPLVLVPGLGASAQLCDDLGYIDALAADHRVIAVDPLGTGGSSRPSSADQYLDEALVEHLSAVLVAEGAFPAILWGWGRGARLAQLYVRRRPAEVALTVLAAVYLGPDDTSRRSLDFYIEGSVEDLCTALEEGDWERGFTFFPDLPAWMTERIPAEQDPAAMLAVLKAGALRPPGFVSLTSRMVAMWGDASRYHALNLELVTTFGTESVQIPGDPFESFGDVEASVAAFRRLTARPPQPA